MKNKYKIDFGIDNQTINSIRSKYNFISVVLSNSSAAHLSCNTNYNELVFDTPLLEKDLFLIQKILECVRFQEKENFYRKNLTGLVNYELTSRKILHLDFSSIEFKKILVKNFILNGLDQNSFSSYFGTILALKNFTKHLGSLEDDSLFKFLYKFFNEEDGVLKNVYEKYTDENNVLILDKNVAKESLKIASEYFLGCPEHETSMLANIFCGIGTEINTFSLRELEERRRLRILRDSMTSVFEESLPANVPTRRSL